MCVKSLYGPFRTWPEVAGLDLLSLILGLLHGFCIGVVMVLYTLLWFLARCVAITIAALQHILHRELETLIIEDYLSVHQLAR
jgi:hypothetical protein